MKKAIAAAAAFILLAPLIGLLGVGVMITPAAQREGVCTSDSLTVGPIPKTLTSHTKDGTTVTLDHTQLTRAAAIITGGSRIDGVDRNAVTIALMAALTESRMRQLSNVTVYPDSGDYEHDGDGSDNDSLGLFQMRPASGWGTVKELMTVTYQVEAFFGGPTGPNSPSPRGLLDIPGWQNMDRGEVAQAIEVSAYPDRYQNWEPVALDILDALVTQTSDSGSDDPDPDIPETSRLVFPLPAGSYVHTSPFGPRTDPITGESSFHAGTDLAAPDGTPIYALADGIVVDAGMVGGYSGQITIEHTIDGKRVASRYIHMWPDGILVTTGDHVKAGDHIGNVGSSGHSTGPHLHLEIAPGGATSKQVDPLPWLKAHHVEDGPSQSDPAPSLCR